MHNSHDMFPLALLSETDVPAILPLVLLYAAEFPAILLIILLADASFSCHSLILQHEADFLLFCECLC